MAYNYWIIIGISVLKLRENILNKKIYISYQKQYFFISSAETFPPTCTLYIFFCLLPHTGVYACLKCLTKHTYECSLVAQTIILRYKCTGTKASIVLIIVQFVFFLSALNTLCMCIFPFSSFWLCFTCCAQFFYAPKIEISSCM